MECLFLLLFQFLDNQINYWMKMMVQYWLTEWKVLHLRGWECKWFNNDCTRYWHVCCLKLYFCLLACITCIASLLGISVQSLFGYFTCLEWENICVNSKINVSYVLGPAVFDVLTSEEQEEYKIWQKCTHTEETQEKTWLWQMRSSRTKIKSNTELFFLFFSLPKSCTVSQSRIHALESLWAFKIKRVMFPV